MKRIEIIYGGRHYSVGGRAIDEFREEVHALVAAGGGWIEANFGDGGVSPASLYVAPGVDIALVPVGDPADDA